jgi:hypothetical protein
MYLYEREAAILFLLFYDIITGDAEMMEETISMYLRKVALNLSIFPFYVKEI